ncbi:MAG: DUF2149 domain-containing protein [Planctomycetota bacterium]
MTRSRITHLIGGEDDDPMLSAINLVDVFLVALVILIATTVSKKSAAAADALRTLNEDDDFTLIKNAGTDRMQIVVKSGETLERFDATGSSAEGTGVVAGTAYRMRDGSMVYVPSGTQGSESR